MIEKDIEEIYKEFHVPHHIINHMKAVANVCEILCRALREKGIKVNIKLVKKAALLHDVLRVCDINSFDDKYFSSHKKRGDIPVWKELREKYGKIGHEKAMAKVLKDRGQEDLAKLVSKHAFFEIDNLKNWEEKILYYADKRIDRDKIVSLKKRFEEGSKRNRKIDDDHKKIAQYENRVYLLEEEFREILGETIDEI